MQELQQAIWELRIENFQDKYFVPQQSLYNIMTPNAVLGVLRKCNIAQHQLQETVDTIVPGACKLFAILVTNDDVDFITRFIEHDQLQQSMLDQRLPFTREQLCNILPAVHSMKIERFLEKQWEFMAPLFSGKLIARSLHKKTVLPFTLDRKIGSGGFGIVYGIHIHDEHCKFEQITPQAVRQQKCPSVAV